MNQKKAKKLREVCVMLGRSSMAPNPPSMEELYTGAKKIARKQQKLPGHLRHG